jgi:tripartite-type tricarboxylate transporter receptor subunit TctC
MNHRPKMLFSLLAKSLIVVACSALSAQASEADTWPNRPVRVVVPYAAGNTGDITFRQIQPQLEARLGVRFLIDNKSGASGNIGAEDVVRAKPDGYTLLLGATNNYVINQHLIKGMRFNPQKDLTPITVISNAPSVVVVNASLPVKTLKELSALVSQSPGKLAFASPGVGTPPHLAAELYKQLAGLDLIHVPYRGSPPAVQGLLGGETQIYITAFSSVAGNVNSGKLKALAVASPQGLSILPAVPSTAQQGLPELVTGNWWGLSAPNGTDEKIIKKLGDAIREILADPAVRQKYSEIGVSAVGNSPAEFAAQINQDAAVWKKVIERTDIKPE